ncbi:MAG: hypothetical protein E7536_09245 [Ruminococcaceae bacterium]|nr:hypothetical protein [Oscillospiraceae bacterium]
MKKFIVLLSAIGLFSFSLCGCNSAEKVEESSAEAKESTTVITEKEEIAEKPSDITVYETITHKVVEDSYSDEGKYLCMGKRNTCTKRTDDPEDFFCYACDPDGDNIEGLADY